jgi:aromatic aminotransferase
MNERMKSCEPPYIEDVLAKYANIPDLTLMTKGFCHWGPPQEALAKLRDDISVQEVHQYSECMGHVELKEKISKRLLSRGFDTSGLDITITAGANQAFADVALALCDPGEAAGSCSRVLTKIPRVIHNTAQVKMN